MNCPAAARVRALGVPVGWRWLSRPARARRGRPTRRHRRSAAAGSSHGGQHLVLVSPCKAPAATGQLAEAHGRPRRGIGRPASRLHLGEPEEGEEDVSMPGQVPADALVGRVSRVRREPVGEAAHRARAPAAWGLPPALPSRTAPPDACRHDGPLRARPRGAPGAPRARPLAASGAHSQGILARRPCLRRSAVHAKACARQRPPGMRLPCTPFQHYAMPCLGPAGAPCPGGPAR